MQRLGGLLLMLAGVSLGAYTFLPPPIDGKQALREMTRISAAPDRARPSDEAVAAAAATANVTTVAKAETAASARPADTASISKPASTWSAIVTAETAAQGHMRSLKPGDDGARAQLTRDLQTELKRVGCYGGDVSGNWTPSTKRAMGSFMDRVNATLPMDEPDYILLTLVQGHAEIACGAGCPAGQAIADNGRCVPNAVLARDARKSQREEVANVEDPRKAGETRVADEQQKSADRQKLADGRRDQERLRLKKADDERRAAATMASATYRPAGETGAISDTASQQSNQVVAQSGQERLPWLSDDLSLPAPSTAPARAARPDGIMSIGGPRLAKAEITDSAASVTPEAGPAPVTVMPEAAATTGTDTAVAPRQGAVGTKSGPVAIRGLPGTKSGVAVRGLAGSKSGAAAYGKSRRFPSAYAALNNGDAIYYGYKPANRKVAYPLRNGISEKRAKAKPNFASSDKLSKRMLTRPGTNSYRMLSAMGGVF